MVNLLISSMGRSELALIRTLPLTCVQAICLLVYGISPFFLFPISGRAVEPGLLPLLLIAMETRDLVSRFPSEGGQGSRRALRLLIAPVRAHPLAIDSREPPAS